LVTLGTLWLPIVVATVLVFVASNLVWMVLPHHKKDTRRLPDEAAALEVLGKQGLTPAVYRFPWADMSDMGKPEVVDKFARGPVGLLTIRASGPVNMGPAMAAWVTYIVVITVAVAVIAERMLPLGAPYVSVFKRVGAVAILAYSAGNVPNAIWWGKPWRSTFLEVLDGVAYGLVTAGAFGWLWPR
jgi:hypothetical protein